MDTEKDKRNGKASAVVSDFVSKKHRENAVREMSLNSFLKASPFLSSEVEEDDEMTFKPSSKSLPKEWHNDDETSKQKSKVTQSAQKLFERGFSKWQNAAYSQFEQGELNAPMEETYLSEKQEKAMAAAFAKREFAGKLEELSPKVTCKMRRMAKSPPDQCSERQKSDRESFTGRGVDSPPMSSRKQEAKFNISMDYIGDNLTR